MSEFGEARSRLRAANPVLSDEVPSPDSPQAVALFQRIIATEPMRTSRRKRVMWRRVWVLVPAAMLASAAGYGLFHKVTQPLVVACYSQPRLSAAVAVVSSGDQGPVAACGSLWNAGGEFNPAGNAGAPPLSACVLDAGAIGVFPATNGSDTCSALGLAPAGGPAKEEGENEAILAVQTALSVEFISRCVGRDEAVSMAGQELDSEGLRDWQVVSDMPFSVQEPCASLAVDVPGRTISLVPVSDSP